MIDCIRFCLGFIPHAVMAMTFLGIVVLEIRFPSEPREGLDDD